MDAASALAVVVGDNHGEVICIWGTRHRLCTSAQAEAEALLWAVNLAILERRSLSCLKEMQIAALMRCLAQIISRTGL